MSHSRTSKPLKFNPRAKRMGSGVYSLEDIRAQCVIRDGAWHWTGARTGSGAPACTVAPGVVSESRMVLPVLRLAWVMSGRKLQAGHLVWNTRGDMDDVNPANAQTGTRAEFGVWLAGTKRNVRKPTIVAANARIALSLAISPDEVASIEADISGGLSHREIAVSRGRSTDLVNRIAKGLHIHQRPQTVRGASVFSWGRA
jgi:hypothetical protein